MPVSGETRKSTRLFGVKVLRSGRRCFTTQEAINNKFINNNNNNGCREFKENRCREFKENPCRNFNKGKNKGGVSDMMFVGCRETDKESKLKEISSDKINESNEINESSEVNDREEGRFLTESKRWGIVYSRKRTRGEAFFSSSDLDKKFGKTFSRSEAFFSGSDLDKKFGKKFTRSEARKKIVTEDVSLLSVLPTSNTDNDATKSSSFVKSRFNKRKRTRGSVDKRSCLELVNLPELPLGNGVAFYGGIQKRRSSLRTRDLRSSSRIGNLKSGGGVVRDGAPFFAIKSNPVITRKRNLRSSSRIGSLKSGGGVVRDGGVPFFAIKANPVITRPIQKVNLKELKEITQDIESASCNASILVIESDRCRRELGAVITMEMVELKRWFLVVKLDGVVRFRVDALNVMRPCFCNRVTHAIIWAGDDESWRLEFFNRQDWFIFKELYRNCSEKTVVQNSLASIIPVPRVIEVSDYADEKYVPFKMPDLYISSTGDEISRTLEMNYPIYDMDSDDDEWLNKFNDGRDTSVDEVIFEKIIDAFERGVYCNPEDYADVTMAVDRCLVLASKDVLEAVYDYWIAKRKKHSALVRVFQLYKPKRPEQLNFKSVLRKKRSFRQRGTQTGRGKQLTFFKAAIYEETETVSTEMEAENTVTKVEETQAAANWAEQVAVMNRQRAQLLMKVADLLTYKAAMAVKIAESRTTPNDTIDELFLSSGFT